MIVFGQDPVGPSKLAQLCRIDPPYRQARRQQCTHDAALVSAGRFKPDRRNRQAAQMLDQSGPAGGRIGDRQTLLIRQNHDIQTVHRDIDADSVRLAHLRTPSLLMRARALATVRVWKRRLEHQAHSRSDSQNAFGLPAVAGTGS
jgi:hypothetical protein